MPPTHITVTAPPDVHAPIHPDDGVDPAGGQLRVTTVDVVRVRFAGSQSVRRAIRRGDLIPCNMDGMPVPSVELAACPVEPTQGAKWPRDLAKVAKAADTTANIRRPAPAKDAS